jgi:hypothetical protein
VAELIKHILALPRSEKLQIIALLAIELQKEEGEMSETIPQWQVDLAKETLDEIESGKIKALEHEAFWAEVDAKVEKLENP